MLLPSIIITCPPFVRVMDKNVPASWKKLVVSGHELEVELESVLLPRLGILQTLGGLKCGTTPVIVEVAESVIHS